MSDRPPVAAAEGDELATDNLPASVRELISLIGLAPTLALVNKFAGQILVVPTGAMARSKTRSRLVEIIGEAATALLIWNFPGARLTIPRCVVAMRDARDRRIIAAYTAGVPVGRLAAENFLTDRQIRTIIKRSPGAAVAGLAPGGVQQLGLFDG